MRGTNENIKKSDSKWPHLQYGCREHENNLLIYLFEWNEAISMLQIQYGPEERGKWSYAYTGSTTKHSGVVFIFAIQLQKTFSLFS